VTRIGQVIRLADAELEFTDFGCTTRFDDGAHVDSIPHNTPHYCIVAARCGYGDDVMAYCREHDALHLLVSERLLQRNSILWSVAHGFVLRPGEAQAEEALVQLVQRYVRANEEPIIADYDWAGLKTEALELLLAVG
jgi:hypothetical protein